MTLSLRRVAGLRGTAPAFVFDSETLSWSDVLCALPEVEASRPLTLVARRDSSSILAILAAIEASVPLVLLHPRATPGELIEMRALFADWSTLPAAHYAPEDRPLAYVFTSGSTGVPRAAMLSRRAFIASARASAANLPYGAEDRWLLAMPLAHVGGLSVLTRTLLAGATAVVAPEGRASASDLVQRMASHAVTHASLVPAMLRRILGAGFTAPPSLRAVLLGGAPAPSRLLAEARSAGWPVVPTYGSTETCSQVATRSPEDTLDADGRVGRPLPGVDVRIVDGEIQVRGPMLFDGYLTTRGDGASHRLIPWDGPAPGHGYFATGDLGRVDADGVLWVEGRRSELIISGGENVHPAGIEAVLGAHPEVVEACAYGLPDDRWGEIVAAAYRSESGPIAGLDGWLRERLAPHRRPKRLTDLSHLSELPKTPSGKVDRAALVRRALSALEQESPQEQESVP